MKSLYRAATCGFALLMVLSVNACSKKAKPKSGGDNASATPTPTPTAQAEQSTIIDIREVSSSGNTLIVNLNQTANWKFEARNASGTVLPITSIQALGQVYSGFRLNGSDGISFTPQSEDELTGSLSVSAGGQSQNFNWQSDGSTSSSGGLNGIIGLLPKIFSGTFQWSDLYNLVPGFLQNIFGSGNKNGSTTQNSIFDIFGG